jgi:hypothetical protein
VVLRNLAGVNEIRKYMVSDAGAVLVSLAHLRHRPNPGHRTVFGR